MSGCMNMEVVFGLNVVAILMESIQFLSLVMAACWPFLERVVLLGFTSMEVVVGLNVAAIYTEILRMVSGFHCPFLATAKWWPLGHFVTMEMV